MRNISASAPGKFILFGEHAVVHGRPAVAAPLAALRATATVGMQTGPLSGTTTVIARNLNKRILVSQAAEDEPLAAIVRATFSLYGLSVMAGLSIVVSSSIPVASGLGSSAAVSTAIVRALASWLGKPLTPALVSALVYETEKLHHGQPSGIDNTVVAYERPVYFIRDRVSETFEVGRPVRLLIADTGVPAETRVAVGLVSQRYEADTEHIGRIFDQIGAIASEARLALEAGETEALGPLMDENHGLLQELGVSSAELDRLVEAARAAGARGAKLSGGGLGGNMLALVDPEAEAAVERALTAAGARRVVATSLE
jgi:mevalonate kinase